VKLRKTEKDISQVDPAKTNSTKVKQTHLNRQEKEIWFGFIPSRSTKSHFSRYLQEEESKAKLGSR